MKQSGKLFTCFILAILLGFCFSTNVFSKSTPVPEALKGIGGDFVLHSQDGDVALKDFRGKVVLLYFGFINCPDACPVTLSNWTKAFDKLSAEEQQKVNGLMVSVDPERDSYKKLKLFTAFFHENIVGATGSLDELRKVTALYRTSFIIPKHEPGKNYGVKHSIYVYVIDPNGQLRDLLDFGADVDAVLASIRESLQVTQ